MPKNWQDAVKEWLTDAYEVFLDLGHKIRIQINVEGWSICEPKEKHKN